MAILPKVVHRFSVTSMKVYMPFFTKTEKKPLKFIGKHKRPHLAKATLSKKNTARRITTLDFKLY